jgi:hypothetical protein
LESLEQSIVWTCDGTGVVSCLIPVTAGDHSSSIAGPYNALLQAFQDYEPEVLGLALKNPPEMTAPNGELNVAMIDYIRMQIAMDRGDNGRNHNYPLSISWNAFMSALNVLPVPIRIQPKLSLEEAHSAFIEELQKYGATGFNLPISHDCGIYDSYMAMLPDEERLKLTNTHPVILAYNDVEAGGKRSHRIRRVTGTWKCFG